MKGMDKRENKRGNVRWWQRILRTTSTRDQALHQQCVCCSDINAFLSPAQRGDGETFEAE